MKNMRKQTWNNTDVRRTINPPRLFLGLVVIADAKLPIPSRTRPISASTPMVLRLKTWESRSPPNLERDDKLPQNDTTAGWSSPVARQAHNLKAAGSNPAPATKISLDIKDFKADQNARLSRFQILVNTWSTFTEPPFEGADNRRQSRHSTSS